MSYSQNSEESVIVDYFGERTAKFIDIGAYDVFRLSNTRRLYELGWSGILVEADPINYKTIADHYKDDPRIEVVEIAIGISNEPLTFYTSGGDAVSTSVVDHKTKWEGGGVKFTPITVSQVHVKDFMDSYFSEDVKLISLDTEATNMEIFREMPEYVWKGIDLFCIEHDNCEEEIEARLRPYGFKSIYHNAENLILGK